ncbi:hypothetical protein SK571_03905 [Lentzea sp. BCCO 10_0798]|uniref:Uncharacterized protein n=1 Tax=Lentzea kristufekii TaxID=3095430 RepID=A0ABU4TJS9_9PSEU|nr:hypothetical protein [Lentzea sp. BCCO 10_0798]MDX8048515.1 hypothetical protein [Lentzea sp. BCCO 10_0798]
MHTDEIDGEFSPDGLNESAIDALIAAVNAELVDMPAPTSRLLDGVAAVRWERREANRVTSHTVRVLRTQVTSVPTGTEAA